MADGAASAQIQADKTSESAPVVIGTRESQLAMVQAEHVRDLLQRTYPHLQFAIHGMTTTGDRILDVALSKIGSKSLFTKELEVALDVGSVDLVVHSLKDLPTTLPTGMALGAILEREDPRDALIISSRLRTSVSSLEKLPSGAVIGTSSVRRTAQLRRRFPHLVFQDVRGNLNTRLKKLDADDSPYSALLLAYAGVHRLGWTDRISQILEPDTILHAVGQGALGIECRDNDDRVKRLLDGLNHTDTRLRCLSERSFMRTLEGGCSVPLGVFTRIENGNGFRTLHLIGSVTRLDGSEEIRESSSTNFKENDGLDAWIRAAENLGTSLAQTLLSKGARAILDEIRKPETQTEAA